MNKVISISLNGNAYQLEEAGFELLKQYLQRAETQLKDNPDKKEILSDLEQAIADKCANYLRPHKNVITSDEVTQIIKDMGPVDPGSTEETAADAQQPSKQNTAPHADTPKRLYQILDGAIISGLCKGISAYFNIDVSLVRIAFVFLVFITGGMWALVYLIMMFLIPYANTTEDMAAARGAPFNAQEVIDQAKKHYSEFKDSHEWKRHWRNQRRQWRQHWRHQAHWWGYNMQRNINETVHQSSYAARVIAGLLLPVLSIVGVLVFWAWMLAVVSVATTGAVFGWHVPVGNTPSWVLIIIMLALCGMTSAPIKSIHRALSHAMPYPGIVWAGILDTIVGIGLSALIIWYAYQHFPQVQYFINHFQEVVTTIWNNISKDIHGTNTPAT